MSIRHRRRGLLALSIQHKRRELLSTLTPRVGIASILAAALLTITAASASAYVNCPPNGNRAGDIDEWETIYPTEEEPDHKGVTMCLGEGDFGWDKGWLQIVDLGDGAKIRLIADREPTGPESSTYEPETVFRKRTAEDWYRWIRSLNPFVGENWAYTQPRAGKLFSTTNANFFKDTDNEHNTTMTFPRSTWGVADTWGMTERLFNERAEAISRFDWEANKRSLQIGYHNEYEEPFVQAVDVDPFPTHYEYEDLELLGHVGGNPEVFDTIDFGISMAPEVTVGESTRRNYLGVYYDKVYIFTSDSFYTNAEAIAIMNEIQRGMDLIQLDGGGSAQVHSAYGGMRSRARVTQRQVADVIAIYKAGEPWDAEEEEQWLPREE